MEKNMIDIPLMIKTVWEKKRLFLKVWGIVLVVSAALILCVPRYYTTTTRVAPEFDSGTGAGALSSIASSFGFDIGEAATTDAISPLLYPDLMEDNGFVARLFEIKVRNQDGDLECTYYEYLDKHQKKAWWTSLIQWVKSLLPKDADKNARKGQMDPYRLSRKQTSVMTKVRDKVTFRFDKKTSVITISVEDQDPLICKQVADAAREKLQEFITDYRTNKARTDVAYYEKLCQDAKSEYETVRRKYSSYADSNTDVILPSAQAAIDDLENDMQLKYNTYTAIQTQLQAARAKVREKTPAFTLLQGANVPIKPAGPKRMIFVIAMLFLATIVTTLVVCRKLLPEVI